MKAYLIEGKLISVNTDDKEIVIRTKEWGNQESRIEPTGKCISGTWTDYIGCKVEAVEVDGVITAINYAEEEEEE